MVFNIIFLWAGFSVTFTTPLHLQRAGCDSMDNGRSAANVRLSSVWIPVSHKFVSLWDHDAWLLLGNQAFTHSSLVTPLNTSLVHYGNVAHQPFHLAGRQAFLPLNKQIYFSASCVSWDKNKDMGNLLNDIQISTVCQVKQLQLMQTLVAGALS